MNDNKILICFTLATIQNPCRTDWQGDNMSEVFES